MASSAAPPSTGPAHPFLQGWPSLFGRGRWRGGVAPKGIQPVPTQFQRPGDSLSSHAVCSSFSSDCPSYSQSKLGPNSASWGRGE